MVLSTDLIKLDILLSCVGMASFGVGWVLGVMGAGLAGVSLVRQRPVHEMADEVIEDMRFARAKAIVKQRAIIREAQAEIALMSVDATAAIRKEARLVPRKGARLQIRLLAISVSSAVSIPKISGPAMGRLVI